MSVYTTSIAPSTTTTALIRAIAHFIVDQLAAWGWVQASDTGQTATDSLPALTGAWTTSGIQIWRMNDALQSTAPVFLRIEFRSGSPGGSPDIKISVGTGTNGAGVLTGQVSDVIDVATTVYGTTVRTSYASGASNRCAFALFSGDQNTTDHLFWSIERSKDADGNDTADGIIIIGVSPNSTYSTQYIPASGSIRAKQLSPALPVYSGITTLANGSTVGLIPVFPQAVDGPKNPGNNVMFYYQPDLIALNAVSAIWRGSSHVILPLGVITTAYTGWATHSYAMLYE